MKRVALSSVVALALAAALLPNLALAGQAGRRGGGGREGGRREGPPAQVFFVQLMEKGAKTGMTDALILRESVFTSMACHQYGFTSGTLKETKTATETKFDAMTKSKTQGTMNWSGTVKGNAISGTLKWTPMTGAAKEYTFTGTRHERRGELDGTTWKVDITPQGGKAAPNSMMFREGAFDVATPIEAGFRRGPYTAMKKGGEMTFTAFLTGRGPGAMQIDGKVQGTKISGTIMMYPEQGAAKKYTFSGAKQ